MHKVLFKSDKSDFIKIGFFTIVNDFDKLVLVSKKDLDINEEKMIKIGQFLIDYWVAQDKFWTFEIFLNEKNLFLYDTVQKWKKQ